MIRHFQVFLHQCHGGNMGCEGGAPDGTCGRPGWYWSDIMDGAGLTDTPGWYLIVSDGDSPAGPFTTEAEAEDDAAAWYAERGAE